MEVIEAVEPASWIRGSVLIAELLKPSPIQVLDAAREFRRRGMAGAVFVEILALLRFQREAEMREAFRMCQEVRSSDWYKSLRNWSGQLTPEGLFEAAKWISDYELESYSGRMAYDPALRVQETAIKMASIGGGARTQLSFSPLSEAERHAFECLIQLKSGNVKMAFNAGLNGLRVDRLDPWVRRAVNRLFYQVPRRQRAEIFIYGPGGMRNWGISPIQGLGMIFKEFTGYIERPNLHRTTRPQLPLVNVVRFENQVQFKKFPDEAWRRIDQMLAQLSAAA